MSKQAPGSSSTQQRSQTSLPLALTTTKLGENPGSRPNHTLHGRFDTLMMDDSITTSVPGE
jgi:hypothetical protein